MFSVRCWVFDIFSFFIEKLHRQVWVVGESGGIEMFRSKNFHAMPIGAGLFADFARCPIWTERAQLSRFDQFAAFACENRLAEKSIRAHLQIHNHAA